MAIANLPSNESLKSQLRVIDDVYSGKVTDKYDAVGYYIKRANEYIAKNPNELLELSKSDLGLVERFFDRKEKENTWIKTKESDRIHCEIIKKIIKNNAKWSDNYVKYYLMRKIFTRCIGTESTLELIKLKDSYKGASYKHYFKNEDYYDIDTYPELEKSYRQHVSLYNELADLKEKDLSEFTFSTFAYAHEKRENKLKETKEAVAENRDKYIYTAGLKTFLNDLLQTEKMRTEDQKKKENKTFDAQKMKTLISLLEKRGGGLDLKGFETINNIVTFSAIGNRHKNSSWEAVMDRRLFGILSLQTFVKDKDGKLIYVISYPYGKAPDKDSKFKEALSIFYIAKVQYENDEPVNLIASKVYSNQELHKCLQQNIYLRFKIDFNDIRDSKILKKFEAYNVRTLGFFGPDGNEFWKYPYAYFPKFDGKE